MVRPSVRGIVCACVTVTALVACGGDSSDEPEADSTTTTSTASSTTTSSTSTTATEPKAAGEADVDLRFTGTLVINVTGKTGRCNGTADSFGFEVTNADYEGVGESLSVSKSSGSPGDIKYVFDANRAWNSSAGAKLTFSSDLKTVQIDDDLSPVSSGGASPGPLHLSGTITCP